MDEETQKELEEILRELTDDAEEGAVDKADKEKKGAWVYGVLGITCAGDRPKKYPR